MRQFLYTGIGALVSALLVVTSAAGQDLNGDGKVDAVFTQKQQFNQVCFGDGTGAFTSCTDVKGAGQFELSAQINTTKATLVDFNDDGALDIIFAMEGHANVVCYNDGFGKFSNGLGCLSLDSYNSFPYDTQDVAVGDLDGDGAPDVVFANGGNAGLPLNQPNVVCNGFNTGGTVCRELPGPDAPSTGVALGDVDGDGRLDAIFSNHGAKNAVCLNTGTDGSGIVFDCREVTPASNVLATKVSNAVAVGNLPPGYNGTPDGFLDVAFANTGKNEVCLGNGDWSGSNVGLACVGFNTVSSYTLNDATATTSDVVIANILPNAPYTGDEIIFTNVDAPNVRCFGLFTCSFTFQPSHIVDWNGFQVSEPIPEASTGVAVADIDGDGQADDVVIANAGVSRTYMSLYTEVTATDQPLNPTSVALGDLGFAADIAPPVLSGAADITVEATSPAGANVNLNVLATDDVDGTVAVACTPSSGTFPVGNTPVTCSAVDSAGNTGTASFTVTVQDTTAPAITVPTDFVVQLTAATSTVVDFSAHGGVSATDIVDGDVTVTCTPPSGSVFSEGTTTVNCSAIDAHGNQSYSGFHVTVAVVYNTQPGSAVEVSAGNATSVTFGGVTTGGLTTSTPVYQNELPHNFDLGGLFLAYEVTTSATVTGPIDVCFTIPGLVSAAYFHSLRAWHLEQSNWVDRTILPQDPKQPNYATQTICARTNSLSPFVIGVPAGAGIGSFVAFSLDSTVLMNGTTVVSGDVGANTSRSGGHDRAEKQGKGDRHDKKDTHDKGDDGGRDGVTVLVGNHVTMQGPDSRVVGDTVRLGKGASVFNVLANFLSNRRGEVLGEVTSPVELPYLELPAFPTIEPGTERVTARRRATIVLAPGTYGDVRVEKNATLVMTGGLYQIRSLDVDNSGTVLMQDATEVRILGRLNTGHESRIVIDETVQGLGASQIVFYVAGQDAGHGRRRDRDDDRRGRGRDDDHHGRDKTDNDDRHDEVVARIGTQNVVQATIYAQDGAVELGARTQATGQFIGAHVRIGAHVTLTLDGKFQ